MKQLNYPSLGFLLILLTVIGCSSENTGLFSEKLAKGPCLMIHDFDVVRPRTEQTCVFSLKNTSNIEWRIEKIVQNCSCTVATPSSKTIQPGEFSEIKLSYRAGAELIDDRRDSVVYFEQEDLPPITLRIQAKIRPEIVLRPFQCSFSAYIPNQKHTEKLIVHDWTDKGLKTLEFRPEESWISVVNPKINRTLETSSTLPAWEGGWTADTASLSPGRHQGRIVVTARDKEKEYTTYFAISVDVTSVVRVIPSNLFFGEVRVGETSAIRCTLFVVPHERLGLSEDLWSLMSVETDFPKEIVQVELTKESELKGVLTVSLTPKTSEKINGNVFIKIKNGQFHDLTLPVLAHIRSKSVSILTKEKNDENDK